MKIYIAGKFEAREEIRGLMNIVEANGHTITHDWTKETLEGKTPEEHSPYLQKCALQDFDGVYDAETLILIPNKDGSGMFTEMGVAIALFMPIFVVGFDPAIHKANIFYNLPHIAKVDTIEQVIEVLNGWEKRRKPTMPDRIVSGLDPVASKESCT